MIEPEAVTQAANELIKAAVLVRERAYAPYSKFRVGAAVQTESGNVYCGANVENASYGLTICAEQAAIAAAVSNGEHAISAVAIASSSGVPPCGACRQVLSEFAADVPVLLVRAGDTTTDQPAVVALLRLNDLLPRRFSLRGELK